MSSSSSSSVDHPGHHGSASSLVATGTSRSRPFFTTADKKSYPAGPSHVRKDNDDHLPLSAPRMAQMSSAQLFSLGIQTTCSLEPTTAPPHLQCWGSGSFGEFGNGEQVDSLIPIDVMLEDSSGSALEPIYIENGHLNSFIIDEVGNAWSYGKDAYGNLGLGQIHVGDTVLTPHQMIGLPDKPVVKIASFYIHTCILNEEGSVWCVGYNYYGQLGLGYFSTSSPHAVYSPGLVSFSSAVVDVGVGVYHTCALDDQSQLWCFGWNNFGQLGVGNNNYESSPAHVSSLGNVVEKFSVGAFHSCALKLDKSFLCWGRNDLGQVGDGSASNKYVPTEVTLLPAAEVVQFATGWGHTCILDVDNNVFCWGDNGNGQLGVGGTSGGTSHRSTPTQVTFPAGSSPTDIVAGWYHTCAPTASGELYCWGRNDYGQLGTNTNTNEETPTLSLWEPAQSGPSSASPSDAPSPFPTARPFSSPSTSPTVPPSTSMNPTEDPPVASPTTTTCTDRTDQWTIDTAEKYWCTWAANGTDPPTRCRKKDLYTDCPATCDDSCSTTPVAAPITEPAPTPTSGPPDSCSCCDETTKEVESMKNQVIQEMDQMNNRMENLEQNVGAILEILETLTTSTTLSPAPAVSPTASCTDRTDQWALVEGGTVRNWCTWAAGADYPLTKCAKKNLYADCPETCGGGCP